MFHQELIKACRQNKLVVFAGAGVSRSKPAELPDFPNLFKEAHVNFNTGLTLDKNNSKPITALFGDLEEQVGSDLVREYIKGRFNSSMPSDLHKDLINLFINHETPRIITTNYDRLFTIAWEEKTGKTVQEISYPNFVIPEKPRIVDDNTSASDLAVQNYSFDGIAHIHGSILSDNRNLILNDQDFSNAYLGTNGSPAFIRKFLDKVFTDNVILFVGYSLDDPIFSYYLRTIQDKKMFSICTVDKVLRWKTISVETIPYDQNVGEIKHALAAEKVRNLAGEAFD